MRNHGADFKLSKRRTGALALNALEQKKYILSIGKDYFVDVNEI
jgi:hypothetical protein